MNDDDRDMQQEGASEAPEETTPPDVMVEIRRLHKEHGENLNKVAQALNELGIMTPRGKAWNYQNLRTYLTSQAPILLKTRGGKKEKKKTKGSVKTPKTKQETKEKVVKTEESAPRTPPKVSPPPSEPDPLAAYVKLPDQSLTFVDGKTKNGSFKALEDLYRLAEEKAKKDKVRTGGSISSLVQTLLWAYVNGPKEFLVPLYNEESAVTGPATDEPPKNTGKGKGRRPKATL
jgi:hypothetical protein